MRRPDGLAAVRLTGAGCLLAAVALASVTGWGRPAWWGVPLLALVVAVTEVAVVHLQFGRQRYQLSLTEAALAVALLTAHGSWTVLAVAAGVVCAQVARRIPPLKLGYNLAQFALSTAAAVAVAGSLAGTGTGVVAGLAVFWLLNHLLVALAVSLTSGQPFRALVLSSAPLSALHTAGNSSLGLLAGHLALTEPVGLLGLVVPLGLLWSSYDQQTRRSAEARLFAELARGQEQAAGRSPDVSAQVVLTAAARLFGGADVEMVLRAEEGPVRYAGDEHGVPQRLRVDPHAFDEPWVLRALGSRGVTTGVEDGRPWCAAVLSGGAAPLAVLIARRPAGAAPFARGETRLAQVLVGQAESWLSVAELSARHRAATEEVEVAGEAARALGDVGAATAPALSLLRDSSERLARLAARDSGVGPIVEELQLVERAVASLLGAVALAAEPDLRLPAPSLGHAPVRPAAEWTSTGVFR
jgi:hypothetical protein